MASTARLLGEATKHMACTSVAVSASDISDATAFVIVCGDGRPQS